MASGQINAVFRQISRLFVSGSVSGLSEGQLLARFVEKHDESAFEALVSRFGPMVLGVCRQILSDPHAVDDAFQATFLVLVKRAGSIRDRDLLGNWLYGVTLKVAKRARADLAKRKARDEEGAKVRSELFGDRPEFDDPDLGPILHEELARLPEKYRAPVVLCYLDGRTHEEAARLLKWPVGSVKGRLSRAKDLLRDRLGRRGVTASAGLVVATFSKAAEACVPPLLLDQTVKAAMGVAAGGAIAAGLASATAVALSEGVVTSMILSKTKILAMTIALTGTLATGVGVMAQFGGRSGQDEGVATRKPAPPAEDVPAQAKPLEKAEAVILPLPVPKAESEPDRLGEILKSEPPVGALPAAKDLAELRIKSAREFFNASAAFYENGTITIDRLVGSAKDLMDARVDAVTDQPSRVKAVEEYVRMMRMIAKVEAKKYEVGSGALPNLAEARYNLATAEVLLQNTRKGARSTVPASPQPGGTIEEDEEDLQRNALIRQKLNMPISMPFPNEMPLEEVIRYIKTATTGKDLDQGIPIYVDPQGLEEVGKTMASPITFSMEGIKLKTSLRLILKQLGLGYYVREGMVMITSLDSDEYLDAVFPNREKPEGGFMGGGFGGGQGGTIPPGGGGASGGGAAPATPKGGAAKP